MPKLNQKGFINQLLLLLLLAAGIIVGIYLVQNRTNLLPKAGGLKTFTPENSFTADAPKSVNTGSEFKVHLLVRSDIDSANLFTAKLKFPSDLLEVKEIITEDPDAASTAGKFFIKNWVEKTYDNNAGTISLVGGVPNPGYQSDKKNPPAAMAVIVFNAKKEGTATISFKADSSIYRNSDNLNILTVKRKAEIKISNVPLPVSTCQPKPVCLDANPPCEIPEPADGWCPGPTSIPVPTCQPRPACLDAQPACKIPEPAEGWCPIPKGDINGDGKINLVDMSVLLSKWGKQGKQAGRADINGDGVVNVMDYSLMMKILIQNKIINL